MGFVVNNVFFIIYYTENTMLNKKKLINARKILMLKYFATDICHSLSFEVLVILTTVNQK